MNLNQKIREAALRLIGNNNSIIDASKPKVYRAILLQAGTDAPVATVLENTLDGVPVWSYFGEGYYILSLVGAFPFSKTYINFMAYNNNSGGCSVTINNYTDAIHLQSYQNSDLSIGVDDILSGNIEILVYP